MNRTTQPFKKIETIIYTYPNGDKKIIVFNKPLRVRESGWEEVEEMILKEEFEHHYLNDLDFYNDDGVPFDAIPEEEEQQNSHYKQWLESLCPEEREQAILDDNINRSKRRAQQKISHLCHSNDFKYFVTLTLSPEKANDRFDLNACMEQASKWLHQQRRNYGKFHYILVPELHPTSGAVHFHGVIGNYKGPLHTEKTRAGREVFKLTEWEEKLGFTDVEEIIDIAKVSNYIRSYISKDLVYQKSKKKYLSSKGLQKPIVNYNATIPDELMEQLQAKYENKFCTSGYIRKAK